MENLIGSLNELVIDLLMQSMDPDYTAQEQIDLHELAKALRRQLVHLRQQKFDKDTAGYSTATEQLRVVNAEIEAAVLRINDLVKFNQDVSTLISAVDRLIGAAVPA